MATSKKARAAKRAKARAAASHDNRPWYDRAGGKFWKPPSGSSVVLITGEPQDRVNDFGDQVVDIPTSQGVLSTAAYDILRPLAQYMKDKGKGDPGSLIGKRLSFIVTGERQARRFTEVRIQ